MVAARSRLPLLIPPSPLFHPKFDRDAFARTPLLWPITPMDGPYEVAGTMGEARGIEGAERFHAGIDVRVEAGTLVRAVRDGTVTSPIATGDFGSLNEWLRIGSISYVHIQVHVVEGVYARDHVPGREARSAPDPIRRHGRARRVHCRP
jgi:hypothetical protein